MRNHANTQDLSEVTTLPNPTPVRISSKFKHDDKKTQNQLIDKMAIS